MRMDAKRILVPVNGDSASEYAFRWACQVARESKAELHAVHVIEVPFELPLEAEIAPAINKGEQILARVEEIGAKEKCKGVRAKFLRARQAGPAIVLETEDRHMDLVVLGIPYRQRFGSCVLGDTATYVMGRATCQVVCLREPAFTPALALG